MCYFSVLLQPERGRESELHIAWGSIRLAGEIESCRLATAILSQGASPPQFLILPPPSTSCRVLRTMPYHGVWRRWHGGSWNIVDRTARRLGWFPHWVFSNLSLIQDVLVGRKKKLLQNTIMTTLTSSNHQAVEGNVFSTLSMTFLGWNLEAAPTD
jgi:hypothetical protein